METVERRSAWATNSCLGREQGGSRLGAAVGRAADRHLQRFRIPPLQRSGRLLVPRLLQLAARIVRGVALALPPQHHGVDQRLGLLLSDVAEGDDELVERRVDARPAYLLDVRFGVERHRDALVQLLLSLGNKLAPRVSIRRPLLAPTPLPRRNRGARPA